VKTVKLTNLAFVKVVFVLTSFGQNVQNSQEKIREYQNHKKGDLESTFNASDKNC
jgi:hypothetical protein